jgi:acyl-CoA dehydrogenase
MDSCLQTHASRGTPVQPEIERAVREARLGPIGGGTDEIMTKILDRSLGL